MNRVAIALALVLAVLAGPVLGKDDSPHSHGGPRSLDADRPTPLSGSSIYQAASEWTDAAGKRVRLQSLRGRPVALAMVYTSCTTACPLTVARLKLIESTLPPEARERAWFALASFDSERDRPDVLKKFAAARDLDPSRWRLYHGDRAAVRELAMMLGIRYKRNARGDFDHSNVITILDRDGVIRLQHVGLGEPPTEVVTLLERLAQ